MSTAATMTTTATTTTTTATTTATTTSIDTTVIATNTNIASISTTNATTLTNKKSKNKRADFVILNNSGMVGHNNDKVSCNSGGISGGASGSGSGGVGGGGDGSSSSGSSNNHNNARISQENALKCFGSPLDSDNTMLASPPTLFYFESNFEMLQNEFLPPVTMVSQNQPPVAITNTTTTSATTTSISQDTNDLSFLNNSSNNVTLIDENLEVAQTSCNIALFGSLFNLDSRHFNRWHLSCLDCHKNFSGADDALFTPHDPFSAKFKYRAVHSFKSSSTNNFVNYIFFRCKELNVFLNSHCTLLNNWNLSMYKNQSFVLITKANSNGHIQSFDQASSDGSFLILGEIYICILHFFRESFKIIVENFRAKLNFSTLHNANQSCIVNSRYTIFGSKMLQKEIKLYVFANGNYLSICLQVSTFNVKCFLVYKSGQNNQVLLKKIEISSDVFEHLSLDYTHLEHFLTYKRPEFSTDEY